MDLTPMFGFLIAFSIGLITGFEREHHAGKKGVNAVCGVRTFTLVSILGFLIPFIGTNVIVVGTLMVVILSIPVLKALKGDIGMTSSIALVLVFLLGVLSGFNLYLETVILAVIVLPILSIKKHTHILAEVITPKEMEGLLQFAALIAVLLPITYLMGDVNQYVGPGRMFDPFKTVLMVVFVSSISFSSFLIIKISDVKKGVEISSFLAGFVNSAACTASLAQRSSERSMLRPTVRRGIILTNTSMILKDIIIITAVAGITVGRLLLLPVIVLIGVSLSILYQTQQKKHFQGDLSIGVKNPFAILPALKFGLLFLSISSISHVGISFFGDHGVYAASIAGLVSTTSVSASVGVLQSTGTITPHVAVSTVLLALAFGSVSKALIATMYDRELGTGIAVSMAILAVISLLMAIITI